MRKAAIWCGRIAKALKSGGDANLQPAGAAGSMARMTARSGALAALFMSRKSTLVEVRGSCGERMNRPCEDSERVRTTPAIPNQADKHVDPRFPPNPAMMRPSR